MRLHSKWVHQSTRMIVEVMLVDSTHVFFVPKGRGIKDGMVLTVERFSELYEEVKHVKT